MPNLSVMTNKEIKKYQLSGWSFTEYKHLRKKLSVIINKEEIEYWSYYKMKNINIMDENEVVVSPEEITPEEVIAEIDESAEEVVE